MASGIGVTSEDSRRKEIDSGAAFRAIDLLDSEKIEDVDLGAVCEFGFVKGLEGLGHVALNVFECLQNGRAIMTGKSVANQEIRNWIDIASNGASPELERFADSGATAHEWIEDYPVL